MINNRQQSGRRRGRGGQRQNGTGGNSGSSSSGNGRGPESGNRIDNRARGNAAQLLEKYKTLARDAQQAGDRVLTEYYLQFADHYFRVLSETRARYEENNPSRARQEFGNEEQGFEGEEGSEADDDDDFAGSFRQPQRVPQQQPQQQAQPQQNRDNRSNEDRPRENRAREDRPREDRPREDRPREDRPREDRARPSYQREDRPRDVPQRETPQFEEATRVEQPREQKTKEPRVRRDYGDEDRGNRASLTTARQPASNSDTEAEVNGNVASPEVVAPVAPRAVRRPRAQPPVANNRDADDGEARLDIGVLPPSFSIPAPVSAEPVSAEPAPAVTAEAEGEAVAPRRRGRPRKVPVEAPAES